MLPSNASDWETTNPSAKAPGPRRAGGLVVMLGLLVLLIAVIAVAVMRLPTGTLSRPATTTAAATAVPAAAAPAAAAAAGVPVDAPTEQAVQKAIEGLDNAQAQAIATNDETIMQSTAMPAFYQEEVQTNKDLVAGGVTDVKLLKLEWGDITSDGATVTATVYETWSTTFSDGTTEQARDRNVYTLVQDNGAWKIEADVHPDAPAAANGP